MNRILAHILDDLGYYFDEPFGESFHLGISLGFPVTDCRSVNGATKAGNERRNSSPFDRSLVRYSSCSWHLCRENGKCPLPGDHEAVHDLTLCLFVYFYGSKTFENRDLSAGKGMKRVVTDIIASLLSKLNQRESQEHVGLSRITVELSTTQDFYRVCENEEDFRDRTLQSGYF